MWQLYLASSVLGYLLGSIPVGYLVGRRHGIDIRQHGSGNIGATNVVRVLGKKPGYFVFACDLLKGLLAALLGLWVASLWLHGPPPLPWSIQYTARTTLELRMEPPGTGPHLTTAQLIQLAGIIAALGCILGHNFPVWLRFRGGKGVATTVGVLLGLMPAAFLVAAVVWVVAFYALRYVSLASLLAAAVLPVSVFLLTRRADPASGGIGPLFWFSVVAAALIFWRHRANISRLLDGTESRFTPKPKKTPENPV